MGKYLEMSVKPGKAEVEAAASVSEPISKEVKGYVRKNPKTKREEVIKDEWEVRTFSWTS